jgi:hypothetical protein
MNAKERIEEAHGLWELEAVRLMAFVEAGASKEYLRAGAIAARRAFDHWQQISNAATDERAKK